MYKTIWKSFISWIEGKRLQVQFWLTLFTLLLFIATCFMAVFMYWQAQILKNSVKAQTDSVNAQKRSIDLQIKELNLSKRPYVYVEIKDVSINPRILIDKNFKETIHYMVTAKIEFKNEGIIPAVITDVRYFVTTDKDKRHLDTPAYFRENLGAYPSPTIIFPKQENLVFNYGADCSGSAERVYFNVVVSYKGYDDSRHYWYSFISKAALIGNQVSQEIPLKDGTKKVVSLNKFDIIKLEIKGDWDKDVDFIVPKVYVPNWIIEEAEVAKQRQFLKQ